MEWSNWKFDNIVPCIVWYSIERNYVKCIRRLFGSIFFLVYWIPNHAIWDIQAYHHPEYRVKKSCFSLTPILDTIKWVYMNTSITLSGMPCDDSPPPETHPQRKRGFWLHPQDQEHHGVDTHTLTPGYHEGHIHDWKGGMGHLANSSSPRTETGVDILK